MMGQLDQGVSVAWRKAQRTMPERDPSRASLIGQLAGNALRAKMTDEQAAKLHAAMRAGLHNSIVKMVDPDGVLEPAELDRRVAAKRKQIAIAASLKAAEVRTANAVARRKERDMDRMLAELDSALADLDVIRGAA